MSCGKNKNRIKWLMNMQSSLALLETREMPFRFKMEEGWFFKARPEDWCRAISLAGIKHG